jgi:hypothetical protein
LCYANGEAGTDLFKRATHIKVQYFWLKELIDEKMIELIYVPRNFYCVNCWDGALKYTIEVFSMRRCAANCTQTLYIGIIVM